MKHPSNREFFAYWDSKRGTARAPDRSEIDPNALRELLGDIFVLAYDVPSGHPFRVAGTRVCARFGCDLKNRSFASLFRPDSRAEIEEIIASVAEETLPEVAGLSAASQSGESTQLELLLLPFQSRPHTPASLTGLLAPFEGVQAALGNLHLTSWRYLHLPEKILPRALRKLAVARGFMVYEGLR